MSIDHESLLPKVDRMTEARVMRSSTSLVGSYFLTGDYRQAHGVVVAEPAPAVYLVELFSWLVPDSECQVLVDLQEMRDEAWTFYDTAEWKDNDLHSVRRKWESAVS